MADELIPLNMSDAQKAFVIKELAMNTQPLAIKHQFDKLFSPAAIKADAIFEIDKKFKDEIKDLRQEIYSDLSSLPFSFEFTRIAFATSRIQYLLENPNVDKVIRKVDEQGIPYDEEKMRIDDAAIKGYLDFCRQEAAFAKKMALEKILNKIDNNHIDLPAAGFKPVQINVGFNITEDDKEDNT
jgi:uncharacterized protein with ATP-grasp and redox domains